MGAADGAVAQGILANANTVFVIGNQPANTSTASNKFTVYSGINSVPNTAAYNTNATASYNSKIAYLVQDGYATFVVAYNCFLDNTSSAVKYAFITGGATSNYDADKKEDYNVYPAIVDGEITTIETIGTPTFANGTSTSGALYAITQYDGERASTLNDQGGNINQFTDVRGAGATPWSLTGIDNIEISGGTIKFIDNGVTADAGTVTASTKYFLSDRTGSSTVNSVIDADTATGLTGAAYAVYAIKTSSSDSTFKEIYITATESTDLNLTVKATDAAASATVVVSDVVAAAATVGTWTPGVAASAIATPNTEATKFAAADFGNDDAVTLTFTVDPNATIKVLSGNTALAPDADDFAAGAVANDGTYTIAAGQTAAQDVYVAVTNNGTTNYYYFVVDCD